MIAIPNNYKPICKKHWATFIIPVMLGIFGLSLLFCSWLPLKFFGIILIIVSAATIYSLATISTTIDNSQIYISKNFLSQNKIIAQIPITIIPDPVVSNKILNYIGFAAYKNMRNKYVDNN